MEFLVAVMSIPDVCPFFNRYFVIFSLKSEKEGKNLFHGLMEILWDLFFQAPDFGRKVNIYRSMDGLKSMGSR